MSFELAEKRDLFLDFLLGLLPEEDLLEHFWVMTSIPDQEQLYQSLSPKPKFSGEDSLL